MGITRSQLYAAKTKTHIRVQPFSLPRLTAMALKPGAPDTWLKAICNYIAEKR